MQCPSCQASNEPHSDVCFSCGRALDALIAGTVLGGRYEIQQHLGRGGMGMVYRANDRVLEEAVAIKILRNLPDDASMARRFRSEIKLARKVSHRNVCRIHEYGEHEGLRYISMEFLEGLDIRKLLRQGPLPQEEAFDLSIQCGLGLKAIHEVGIVHRDLKAANIMRDARGVVKLMDFGIAKDLDSETTGATGTGQMVGTPEYMSPEQARAEPVDNRTDIYALGIVVFELFTGDVPFRGDTPMSTLFKQIQDEPPLSGPRAAAIPAAVVPVLARAMSKSPADRHQDVGEMVDDLIHAREVTTGRSFPVATPDKVRYARRSNRSPAAETTPTPSGPPTTVSAGDSGHGSALTVTHVMEPAPAAPQRPKPPASHRTVPARTQPPRNRAAPWAAAGGGMLLLSLAGVWLAGRTRDPVAQVPVAAPDTVASMTGDARTTSVSLAASVPETQPTEPTLASAPVPVERPASPPVRRTPARSQPTPTPRLAADEHPPSSVQVAATTATLPPAPAAAPALAPPATEPARPQPPPTTESAQVRGYLQLMVVPFGEVSIDGASLGRVSSKKVPLAPGVHLVRITHAEYQPYQRKVTVAEGETEKLVIDMAEEAIPIRKR